MWNGFTTCILFFGFTVICCSISEIPALISYSFVSFTALCWLIGFREKTDAVHTVILQMETMHHFAQAYSVLPWVITYESVLLWVALRYKPNDEKSQEVKYRKISDIPPEKFSNALPSANWDAVFRLWRFWRCVRALHCYFKELIWQLLSL